MFENEMQTRIACCATALLLGIIFLCASLPPLFLIVPVAILIFGIVADPYETHAVWYGLLSTAGIFDPAALTDEERENYRLKKHYFWFGELSSAAVLSLVFSVPFGFFLAQRTEITLAFTGAAMLFLPLFIFLPKVIQLGMKADTGAILDTFGKNEQVKKVFWAVFAVITALVFAHVMDPLTARQIVGIIAGTAA